MWVRLVSTHMMSLEFLNQTRSDWVKKKKKKKPPTQPNLTHAYPYYYIYIYIYILFKLCLERNDIVKKKNVREGFKLWL